MAAEKETSTWGKVRKFFQDIHLWMGLASGLIVIVVCFTGTVYVFHTEIREAASPALYNLDAPSNATPLTAEEIIKNVEKETRGNVAMIRMTDDPSRPWQVSVRKKEDNKPSEAPSARVEKPQVEAEKSGKKEDGKAQEGKAQPGKSEGERRGGGRPNMGTMYAVNQYTGEVIGDITNTKNGTTEFLRTMFSMHRWLMLDRIEEPIFGELPNRTLGSYITGTATILFTLGVITGIVIWFPRKVRTWRQGLKIKWDANWKRINHDLHNTLAFYSLIFLFLMGVTGPFWSFEWYRDGLRKTLGTYQEQGAPKPEVPTSTIPYGYRDSQKLQIADFIKAADAKLSYNGTYTVNLPQDSVAAVSVSKVRSGFFASPAGDRILLDQYTASVLDMEIFRDKPLNERISGSVKALHMGDVYGTFSKIIYFIACLIATSLPVTGTIIWINRLKKKNRKKQKGHTTYRTVTKTPFNLGAERVA